MAELNAHHIPQCFLWREARLPTQGLCGSNVYHLSLCSMKEKRKQPFFRLNCFLEALRFLDICIYVKYIYKNICILSFGNRKLLTSEICEVCIGVVVKLQVPNKWIFIIQCNSFHGYFSTISSYKTLPFLWDVCSDHKSLSSLDVWFWLESRNIVIIRLLIFFHIFSP